MVGYNHKMTLDDSIGGSSWEVVDSYWCIVLATRPKHMLKSKRFQVQLHGIIVTQLREKGHELEDIKFYFIAVHIFYACNNAVRSLCFR